MTELPGESPSTWQRLGRIYRSERAENPTPVTYAVGMWRVAMLLLAAAMTWLLVSKRW